MKYEWRKHEKELYNAKEMPRFIVAPAQNYIMINGRGNPNEADFSDRVGALYSLAYAIKMEYKKSAAKAGFQGEITDYTVYPLEGVWQALQEAELVKENLEYTIMIRQPDFVGEEMVSAARERVKAKKPTPLLEEVRFDTMQDGKCIEVLHTGPFDDEPASFAKMERFAKENHLERAQNYHREIYLNSANRTEKSKLKTILRYAVK